MWKPILLLENDSCYYFVLSFLGCMNQHPLKANKMQEENSTVLKTLKEITPKHTTLKNIINLFELRNIGLLLSYKLPSLPHYFAEAWQGGAGAHTLSSRLWLADIHVVPI